MANIMMNVPLKNQAALDVFFHEIDMTAEIHRFTAEEMPLWRGFYGERLPQGLWDREKARLYMPMEFKTVTHGFTPEEIPLWRDWDGTGMPQGVWNEQRNCLYVRARD
jgi:hypothetical protein